MSKPSQHSSVIYSLSSIEDETLRSRLEHSYIMFEVLKKDQVEAIRQAQRAQARAQQALAAAALAELDFLIDASEAFELISSEPAWITRRDKNGKVLLECLITQGEIQSIQKSAIKQMRKQTAELQDNDDDDSPTDSMFRD